MATKQLAGQEKTLSSLEELFQARDYFKDNDILLTPPIMHAAYSDRMA
jgi:hypothetical protein